MATQPEQTSTQEPLIRPRVYYSLEPAEWMSDMSDGVQEMVGVRIFQDEFKLVTLRPAEVDRSGQLGSKALQGLVDTLEEEPVLTSRQKISPLAVNSLTVTEKSIGPGSLIRLSVLPNTQLASARNRICEIVEGSTGRKLETPRQFTWSIAVGVVFKEAELSNQVIERDLRRYKPRTLTVLSPAHVTT